jgi:hypothetical protein
MLVTDLSGTAGVTIVEREQLEKVLAELKLNQTNKIDRSSANKVGKLLGAEYLIMGRYFTFRSQLQLNAKLVNVEKGIAVGVGGREKVDEFLALEEDIAAKLRSELLKLGAKKPSKGVVPPAKKRRMAKRLKARTASKYGKALDAMDRGKKREAKRLLELVVKEQPDFRLANRDLLALTR